jgi:hypothetical protein
MRTLRSMTGEMIVVRIPVLDAEDMILVRLHKVDAHGIWVESQQFSESILKRVGVTFSRTTIILFIPFHKVDFILSSENMFCLSETAFGLH